jgi:hypothetical protein
MLRASTFGHSNLKIYDTLSGAYIPYSRALELYGERAKPFVLVVTTNLDEAHDEWERPDARNDQNISYDEFNALFKKRFDRQEKE